MRRFRAESVSLPPSAWQDFDITVESAGAFFKARDEKLV
jgi:hypothetical protein